MSKLSRRQIMAAGGGTVAVVAAGVGARLLLRKRYAPTPYDDLIAKLEDRDAGAQIGEMVLAEVEDFDPVALSSGLRSRIAGRKLAAVVSEDASSGRLVEGGGWVLPETLGLICALAAKAAG
jgi:hypothetical protein